MSEIYAKDISGMSNQTYVLALKEEIDNKIVIRFFMSKASNFEIESEIFKLMGE